MLSMETLATQLAPPIPVAALRAQTPGGLFRTWSESGSNGSSIQSEGLARSKSHRPLQGGNGQANLQNVRMSAG